MTKMQYTLERTRDDDNLPNGSIRLIVYNVDPDDGSMSVRDILETTDDETGMRFLLNRMLRFEGLGDLAIRRVK